MSSIHDIHIHVDIFKLFIYQALANQGTTVSFPIIPTIIGSMRLRVTATTTGAADAVQRDLLVEVSLAVIFVYIYVIFL